ncbi:MAG: hypothetical protein H0T89_29590 [Deltaproteobacteria bacterium]|nr:hypothetical protein [Deltaproteobacteria bacterium]MDQ3296280.1 hypothetical protein [Myxococcota bacterium]
MTKRFAFLLSAALAGTAACVGGPSRGSVEYAGLVTVHSPELVSIQPDVYVLADADQPVFYTRNNYWLYRDDGWYRSPRYDRGWVRVTMPPEQLGNIPEPYAYVRFRSRAQTTARRDDVDPRRPQDPQQSDYGRDDDRPTEPSPWIETEPLQPTRPAQPPQPYPLPPQQQSPLEPQ